AADQDADEAERLEDALRQAGHWDLLLGALDRRLQRSEDGAERDLALRGKARALLELGRSEEALDIFLTLLASNPSDSELLEQAESLARNSSQPERFFTTCLELAERLEAANELDGACALWM